MKKVIVISLALVFVFALSGYVWQNSNGQDGSDRISEKHRFPDFERPEEAPNFSGIVKTIVGNEVTVLKIERKIFNENSDENKDVERDEKSGREDMTTEKRPVPRMGGGAGMGGQLNTGDEDSDQRLDMLKKLSTGEEKITIPVGIKMLKNEDGKMIEASLDDITKDKMLTIWTDKDITNRNIANFVIIK